LGAAVFSAPGCGEREGLGVSVGLGGGVSSGLGVGDCLLCFRFVSGVGLGDGVGEIFFRLGEAVGDGLGVGFFAERFLCLRAGAGVGVGAKIFLIFLPNDSSAGLSIKTAPNNSAEIRNSPTNLRAAIDRQYVIPSEVEESLTLF
jgi:hypothetical protein